MNNSENTNDKRGLLYMIEKVGNKIPHTMALFLWLVVIIVSVSFVLSLIGVAVSDPTTGEEIAVVNLLSISGLMSVLTGLVANFSSFSILGVTIVVGIAMGICEVSGFFHTLVKFSFSKVKSSYVALCVSFLGVFMCSFDGAVSHLVVATLAATIYLSMGKNPLVGAICGYAAAATGSAMEFVPAFWQVAMTPLTIQYAQLLDPSFTMTLMSDSYVMWTASTLAVFVNAFVTVKIIEPRFGEYVPKEGVIIDKSEVTPEQKKALKAALIWTGIYLLVIVIACIPQNSFFRSSEGSLVVDAPLMTAFENLLFFLFFIPGLVYAMKTKQVKGIKDLAEMMEKGLLGIVPFIVLVLVISQFLALFSASNLSKVIAIAAGDAISSMNVSAVVIIVLLFVIYAVANVFIVSGTTQYMVFGPFLIPMFMRLNINPAYTQVLLRLADASTNQFSPLNPFFPVIVSICAKYDEKCGIGKILSATIVYAVFNRVVFIAVLLAFYFFNLPLGISGLAVWM